MGSRCAALYHSGVNTSVAPLPWSEIDCVLLDMDGTLLDLGFDNWFWQQRVPEAYADRHRLSLSDAVADLSPRFESVRGRLEWYCIDHWTRELAIDIRGLKQDAGAAIGWLPGAQEFLLRLRQSGKRRLLVTNAHPATLEIKDARLGVGAYFDALYSTHTFGVPKEQAAFWPALRAASGFDPDRSLFIDDGLPILRAAADYGIRCLRAVRRPDSRHPARETGDFIGVYSVADLL